jgi:hypothetical protein
MSLVPIDVFREFVSILEDGTVEITNTNSAGISLTSAQFGLEALQARLSEFRFCEEKPTQRSQSGRLMFMPHRRSPLGGGTRRGAGTSDSHGSGAVSSTFKELHDEVLALSVQIRHRSPASLR